MKIKLVYDEKGNQIFINEETGEKIGEITSIGNEPIKPIKND